MANDHGGYRQPSNPAPVSGPGRLSRRTDGGVGQQTTVPMTGMGYGENADFNSMQSAAPLAAAPTATTTNRGRTPAGQTRAAASPLFSPTNRPDEPVTAGAPIGPGPGPSPLAPAAAPRMTLADTLRRVALTSDDPRLARLLAIAEQRGW